MRVEELWHKHDGAVAAQVMHLMTDVYLLDKERNSICDMGVVSIPTADKRTLMQNQAAYGMLAHMVTLLGRQMLVPLRYPLLPRLSSANVFDPYDDYKPVLLYTQHGAYLLSSLVESLLCTLGVRVHDITTMALNVAILCELLLSRATSTQLITDDNNNNLSPQQ